MKLINHLVLAFVLLLFIAGAEASTPTERALKRTGNEHLVTTLRDACANAKDQIHCFGIGLSIAGAEAGFKSGRTHGYFGMIRPKDKSAYRWVQIYNKNRYKAKDGYFFYGDRGVLPPSRYCTSEHSSNSAVGCPNGRKNFNGTRHAYSELFMHGKQIEKQHESPTIGGCRYVTSLNPGERLQVDRHVKNNFIEVMLNWIFGGDGVGMVFKCIE